ncbi:DUF3592 domain-containing protein [Spirosoma agri]|uniref:DUF3592 domain-containing protein n=1 Tax=Spirosoma agri TaxID=1987381 RepID=A0A6M0IHE8_9BACT|nr:DUF3592 domain-containing protein [Spirosoma agri]NEU67272.1 hypothetical protein [Spirosoma agri]
MFTGLVATLGRIISFSMSVIVAVLLGGATWASWSYYEEQQLQSQFSKEGQLVSVTVTQADHKQKSWRDILGNTVYLTVTYRGKDYMTRFVMDSTYVGSGDRVSLLYHAGYDAFRQPASGVHFNRYSKESRLIDWTTIRTFGDDTKLLLLCVILSVASFFVISGVITTIVPVPFLQDLARLVLVIVLSIGCVFFTYDAWNYYEYYQTLKRTGHQVVVQVLATDRIAPRHSSRHGNSWRDYDYQATIRYQQQERIIPISADDYTRLKPGDSLPAYYNTSMNDFMSVDFPAEFSPVIMPLFFGFLVFLFVRNGFFNRKTTQIA